MSVLEAVVGKLGENGIPFAVIGAAGLAVQGLLRATLDVDLLTTEDRVLQRSLWEDLVEAEFEVEIRHGDISDPLVGVVSVWAQEDRPVDVIVGEAPWQRRIVEEAGSGFVEGMKLPVASRAGLILLKLYAGGPQDRWDIEQLLRLAGDDRGLREEVSRGVAELPRRAQTLWKELAGG